MSLMIFKATRILQALEGGQNLSMLQQILGLFISKKSNKIRLSSKLECYLHIRMEK